MEKIKLAIIGMGRMGITHYSIINTHPNVEIVSVSDTSKVVLGVLNKYIPNLQIFNDYKELIDKSHPDAVIVCTPSNYHYPICEYACRHKIHVFCEKPFTTLPEDAKRLQDMFEEKGLINQVGYVNRFNDVFMTVREYVKNGLIGEVIRFKSEMFSCTISKPESESSWRAKRENGGGVTYEMASHALDLVDYIVGPPDKIVGASLNQVYSKSVEDIVSATLLYKNGCSGTLYANWCDMSYRKPSNKLELFGTKGKLLADQHGMKLFLNEANEPIGYRQGWNTVYITDIFTPVPFYVRGNEFTRQLYHFADLVLSKKPVGEATCTFADGYNVQSIIHNIFEDSENNSY